MALPKILMVHNYSSWGGNLATVLALSIGLRERGYPVETALPKSEAYAPRFADAGFSINNFEVRSKYDLGAITRLKRIIKEGGFDIIHSHTRRADMAAGYAGMSSGAKTVVTHHGQINLDGATFEFRNGISERVYNFILRNYFAVNIAVSYEIAEELRDMCRVEPGRIRVIANGINGEPFEKAAKRRTEYRRKYGLEEDDIAVVTVASLGRKGHQDIVAAAALLHDDYPQTKYLFAGTGFGRDDIERKIAETGLNDTVRLLGFVEDIPGLMAAGDVFCLPTYSEGLSIAIIEAMAAGLPVAASDVGGNPELVEDGVNGSIFPPRNPAALADALRPLLADSELRRKIAVRNANRVNTLFTSSRMVGGYMKLYSDLIA
ncbi:MAG: glycosyltransferase family 4 protein [bacterium]|nr:glycosyltransferase family 4 protein [bacterium]